MNAFPISFSPDTNAILHAFSSSDHVINCLPSIPKTAPTSASSTGILSNLYDDIHTAHASLRKQNKTHLATTTHIRARSDVPTPHTLGLRSIPLDVRDHIYGSSTHAFHFSARATAETNGRSVRAVFVTHRGDAVATYAAYFERMLVWVRVAAAYAPDACGTSMCVYIYDTPLRKTLPARSTDVVGVAHANTAFTYACPVSVAKKARRSNSGTGTGSGVGTGAAADSEIVIFRHEEWFKVFIHETFHMLGMDFAAMANLTASKDVVREAFPVQSDMQLYEAYTETWATIINACFCSYFCISCSDTNAQFAHNVNMLLGFEAAWRTFQMHKILRFMGLKYTDLYSASGKAVIARANLYREGTNVFAYYVVTANLLMNHVEFMEWCHVHNGVAGPLTFLKTEANTVAFSRLIVKMHENAVTKKNIRAVGTDKCHQGLIGDDEWFANTMRMSVCELD